MQAKTVAALVVGWCSLAAAQPTEPPVVDASPETAEAADPAQALEADLAGLDGLALAERLLRFTAAHPSHPHAPVAAAQAHALVAGAVRPQTREEGGDDPLLTGLLAALAEPDAAARRRRVEALAALGDPRAAPAFGYLARRDPDALVRVAAAAALGAARAPAFEQAAAALLSDGDLPADVRVAAAQALGAQGTPGAAEALGRIAREGDAPVAVRQAAVDVLWKLYPEVARRLQLQPRVADSSGRLLGTGIGAASGAYTLGLVGSLSQDSGVGVTVGVLGGAVIGGTGAYLLARSASLSREDALLMLGVGAWSVPVGWSLGALTTESGCERPCNAVALGVHVGAMTSAWLLRDRLKLTVLDHAEVNAAALSGLLVSLGVLVGAPPSDDRRPGFAVLALGPTLGYLAGLTFAPRLQLSPPMAALAALAFAEAWFTSAMIAGALVGPDSGNLRGGIGLAGAGVGLGAALAASAFWQPSGSDVGLIAFAAVEGNLLGAALPLLLLGPSEEAGELAQIGTAVGGLAAATAVGLLTPSRGLKLDPGDAVMVGLGSAFAAWQGFGWGYHLDERNLVSPERTLGLFLGVTGLGSAALLAASQRLELSAWQAGWLYSGAVWGGWLGYWTAYVLTDSRDAGRIRLATSLLTSAAGLGLSALLVSPLFELNPSTLAWVSLFGVGGMTVASMIAVFVAWDAPGKPVATANLIGTAVGLGAGALLAPRLNALVGEPAPAGSRAGLPAIGVPAAFAGPLMDASGRRVDGVSAQLVWAL